MATLRVQNKAGECLDEVTVGNWTAFKRTQAGKVALLLTLGEDHHVLLDTLKLFRRLPSGRYDARLVKKVALPRKYTRGALRGCDAWEMG